MRPHVLFALHDYTHDIQDERSELTVSKWKLLHLARMLAGSRGLEIKLLVDYSLTLSLIINVLSVKEILSIFCHF